MKQFLRLTYLLLLVLALVACQDENTPTPEATTVTTSATATSPAPSATTEPTATATTEPAVPTATATDEPTALPEPTTEPTATAVPEPTATPEPLVLTISQPVAGSEVAVGTDLTVSGVVDPSAAASVTLSLQAGTAILITGTATVDSGTGAWLTTLAVPTSATGSTRLTASTETEAAQVDITLLPGANPTGALLNLTRPTAGTTLVSGFTAFFEGTAEAVVDGKITIAVLSDGCTTVAAAQSFTIGGGEWRGVLILPQTLTGSACAVVYTGTPGTPAWRQTQVPIVLLSEGETGANRIELGNPAFATYAPGSTITLFGVAVNAPEGEIEVAAALDGTTVLPTTTVAVDTFGYWELELTLPAGESGPLTVTAGMEPEGETITMEWVLTVEP